MKKGMSFGVVIVIVIGLIALVVIATIGYNILFKPVQQQFKEGGWFAVKSPEEKGAVVTIPGTQVKAGVVQTILISGTREEIVKGIVAELLDCYKVLEENDKCPGDCKKVQLGAPTDKLNCQTEQCSITLADLKAEFASRNEQSKGNVFYELNQEPLLLLGKAGQPSKEYLICGCDVTGLPDVFITSVERCKK